MRQQRQASISVGRAALSFRMESGDVRVGNIRKAPFCQLWPDVKSEIRLSSSTERGFFLGSAYSVK
jgi:hypothetical protein